VDERQSIIPYTVVDGRSPHFMDSPVCSAETGAILREGKKKKAQRHFATGLMNVDSVQCTYRTVQYLAGHTIHGCPAWAWPDARPPAIARPSTHLPWDFGSAQHHLISVMFRLRS